MVSGFFLARQASGLGRQTESSVRFKPHDDCAVLLQEALRSDFCRGGNCVVTAVAILSHVSRRKRKGY